MDEAAPRRLWLTIGPAGCGKTTIGAALANLIGAPFLDADAFHSEANLAKMRGGRPLDDDDRAPWLARFGEALHAKLDRAPAVVGACSALKRRYRDAIRRAVGDATVILLYAEIGREELARRLALRRGHFFPSALLDSQLHDFERPQGDELSICVPAHLAPADAAHYCLSAAAHGLR
jgi:carbohydrate kinase (thermoresistant glucokinase family)